MANEIRIRAWVKDEVTGTLGKMADAVDNLGKKGAGATFIGVASAKALGVGISLAKEGVQALVGAVDDSIRAASNLHEAMTKTDAVFGSSAKSVEAWASTAARSFGQSKRQALEAASTFGNLFGALGIASDKSVEMSESITKLASDLASFNNVPVEDALVALRSGLVGEIEPMRKFGVAINANVVEQKALQMGLKKSKSELTESDKVLARYKLILEQTTTAQGDFARTADGMANQQRTLQALAEDTSAKFGEVLLPIVVEFQRTVIKALDNTSMSMDEMRAAAARGSQGAQAHLNALAATAQSTEEKTSTAVENMKGNAAADLSEMRGDLDKTAAAEGDVADAAKAMAKRVKTQTENTRDYFKAMKDGIVQDTGALIDNSFDPIEEALDATAEHFNVKAGVVALAEAKSREAVNSAKSDIVSALDSQATHLLNLGEKGKLTKKQVERFATDTKNAFHAMGRKVPGDVQKIIDKLESLVGFDGSHVNIGVSIHSVIGKGGKGTAHKRASGGPVDPNKVYMVGEEGPELFVAKDAGTIVPNHKLSGGARGGGGSTNLTVTVVSAGVLSPAHGQAIAREVGPYLRDYLNRRG